MNDPREVLKRLGEYALRQEDANALRALADERDALRADLERIGEAIHFGGTGEAQSPRGSEVLDSTFRVLNELDEARDLVKQLEKDPRLQSPLDGPGSHRADLAELRAVTAERDAAQARADTLGQQTIDAWSERDDALNERDAARKERDEWRLESQKGVGVAFDALKELAVLRERAVKAEAAAIELARDNAGIPTRELRARILVLEGALRDAKTAFEYELPGQCPGSVDAALRKP